MRARRWSAVVIGWLPIWGLYASLILTVHRGSSSHAAALVAFQAVACAALLSVPVWALVDRLPWPAPMRPRFVAIHGLAAAAYAGAWLVFMALTGSLVGGIFGGGADALVGTAPSVLASLGTGIWFYVLVAGVSYATRSAARAAQAEAAATRAQLAALRAQLNPHFLFNALHTVVQLIPRAPRRAGQAAEELAGLLRATIEAQGDLITLGEELGFVERYLGLEGLRFADRLQARIDVPKELRDAMVPSFALLTLVENAVRHGVEPSLTPVTVAVRARIEGAALCVEVHDDGVGADPARAVGPGTGLARLRERLAALYGGGATLTLALAPGTGCRATLRLPLEP